MKLTFGTRPSALARWQTQWVISALQEAHSGLICEKKVITTHGDRILDRPLPEMRQITHGSCIKEREAVRRLLRVS